MESKLLQKERLTVIEATNKTVMHSYPGMVALITVSHQDQINIMAAGWHTYISYEPPIYGVAIGRERHTYQLMKDAGSFAVNFVPFEKAEWIQQAGVYSGANVDKYQSADIGFIKGSATNSPILKDAYVAYECETIDINTYGDHDWFAAKIILFYRDHDKFLENGLPNFEELAIPLYIGRSLYTKVDKDSKIISLKIEEH
ncbi:flavin reductase family protein [Mesobacillus subterraneus]|uniref:Flavin reductase n=1 Tax=Mesobacillus subterraneus TaxID=285983 RepID=A0A3R9F038_9BACI|nr:flavin reductase family protein [Mesobacillus subterraneus]RSD26077.1 flavin reductase [Mesobacillus subterraneus]